MEIEVKLRLKSSDDHQQAGKLFGGENGSKNHLAKYFQENFFFDGCEQELSSKLVVLRIRFYNVDEKAVITLKGRAILNDGIGKASEVEEDIDPILARSYVDHPELLLSSESKLLKDTCSKFGVGAMKCLGGFKNVRDVYAWNGHQIELDETKYDWGTLYEIECETVDPESMKAKLETLLKGHGITYEYSKVTKFKNFINRTLL